MLNNEEEKNHKEIIQKLLDNINSFDSLDKDKTYSNICKNMSYEKLITALKSNPNSFSSIDNLNLIALDQKKSTAET